MISWDLRKKGKVTELCATLVLAWARAKNAAKASTGRLVAVRLPEGMQKITNDRRVRC